MAEYSQNSKLRVGVFMGGRSIEREVSFNSGRTICDHLDAERFTIIPLFQREDGKIFILPWYFLHRGKITDFLHRLEAEGTIVSWDGLKKLVDFIYLTVHGRYAEDGTLQGALEVLGIPYLGTKVFGSALNMNKIIQKSFLKINGIEVAKDFVINPYEKESLTLDVLIEKMYQAELAFPVIVKPSQEGSSLGINVAFNTQALMEAIDKAMHADGAHAQAVLIEEKLDGMEFTCVSLQKESGWFSLPITEVIIEENSNFFDYDQKYMPGRASKITPARCDQNAYAAIIKICLKATIILNMATISRIDGFLTKDGRIVIIDPNTITGMAPTSFIFNQAAQHNMNHTDLINFLIEQELISCGLLIKDTKSQEGGSMVGAEKPKIRVGVLLGGDSNEREISLESGRNVCYKLSPHKYEITPLFVNDHMELFKLSPQLLIKNSTKDIAKLLTDDIKIEWAELPAQYDFIFIGLHGGKGENGAVQGILEMLDVPYNGSGVLASSLCMDKFQTNTFLKANGFNVSPSKLIEREQWESMGEVQKEDWLAQYTSELSFPIITKPHDDGCSVMVNKAENYTELLQNVITFFSSSQKKAIMIEEMIVGYELSCGVVGNDNIQAFPPSLTVAKKGILSLEEKFLPGEGENQTPAPLPTEALKFVKDVMEKAYRAVQCKGYVRIDCFYQDATMSPTGKERVVILEFNTLPALTPATCLFHQAAEINIKPMELIDNIIELGFALHKKVPVVSSEITKSVKQREKEQDNQTLSLF